MHNRVTLINLAILVSLILIAAGCGSRDVMEELFLAPTATPTSVFVESGLPPAAITIPSLLYASPNRNEAVLSDTISADQTVYVMGRNATGSHLRVAWNNAVGWVPVSFTNYNGQRQVFDALPVFIREPPACAVPITTQFGLNSNWTSTDRQRIAIIVDLFRSKYGDFPQSSLSLVVNGKTVDTSRRPIVERGQFPLKDVVFALPQDVQPGDAVGYFLETNSSESLSFIATIFGIPTNCQWKID